MFIIHFCITVVMIDELLDDDELLVSILKQSHFTNVQIDSLLLAFQYKIEGCSLSEIVKMRDSGPVSKGSYLRTLKQAKNNFRRSLYTLLLAVYLGILDTNTVEDFIELSNKLNSLKGIQVPEEVVSDIERIVDEISNRITAEKVI